MESEADIHDIVKSKSSEDASTDMFLQSKIIGLKKMKEDLKRAKEHVTQSWLDSRPLIDKLEKKQAELASIRDRVIKANLIVSELQLQLETIQTQIRSEKEGEDKHRNIINEKNQELHRKHEEMEKLKFKIDRKRRRRSKLKQVLKIKRQTLQTMDLTHKAIRLESQAFFMSEAQALRYVEKSEEANVILDMNREDYEMLKRKACDETLLAERRISLVADVKVAAERRRDLAFTRLRKLYRYDVTRRVSGSKIISRDQGKSQSAGGNKGSSGKKYKDKKGTYSFKMRKPLVYVRIKVLLIRISKCFK